MASDIDTLRTLLLDADFPAIINLAEKERRTLSFLTALTYDQDRTISWRAVEALGLAASRIAEDDPEYVRVHLRRLVWLLNDESGGIGWRAPEALGEIIHNQPDLFAEFIPILVHLMDMEPEDALRFRAGWLWAIGRLALVKPEESHQALPWITPCLDDPDPQVRGMAVWCLGKCKSAIPVNKLKTIQLDPAKVEIYNSPDPEVTSIKELVKISASPA